MIIYSSKIIQFINEIKTAIKRILSDEIRLKVMSERFLDRKMESSYPIKAVIYNHKKMLGYFDPEFYELGFHERLMFASKKQLHDLIRHELAHYMTFINYGYHVQPHGAEFRAFCERMGWGEEVYAATTCLDDGEENVAIEDHGVLRKVQKLMALSTSSNQNEAEQAMIKSQQLLLKHNVDAAYIYNDADERVYLKRILKQKRENAKMRAIARILETFFVNTVYSKTEGFIYLEILGSTVNLEIAEYVAEVLQHELEKLWAQAQRLSGLKGTVAKNSFFLGIAKGYCNKINALKQSYTQETTRALMVVEKQLVDAKAMVYKRLSSSKSSGGYCPESGSLGERMGKQLHINPAISRSENSKALIGFY